MQRERPSASALECVVEAYVLIGSKERQRCSMISLFHSNHTLTLELFHNTDDGSAPREISPMATNIEAAYCNANPIIMH